MYITDKTRVKVTKPTDIMMGDMSAMHRRQFTISSYKILEEIFRLTKLHIEVEIDLPEDGVVFEEEPSTYTLTIPSYRIIELLNISSKSTGDNIISNQLSKNQIDPIIKLFNKIMMATLTTIESKKAIISGFAINKFELLFDGDYFSGIKVRIDKDIYNTLELSNDSSSGDFAIIPYKEKLVIGDLKECFLYDWLMTRRPMLLNKDGLQVSFRFLANDVLHYPVTMTSLRSCKVTSGSSGAYIYKQLVRMVSDLNEKVSFKRYEKSYDEFKLGPSEYKLVVNEIEWTKPYTKDNPIPNVIFKLVKRSQK